MELEGVASIIQIQIQNSSSIIPFNKQDPLISLEAQKVKARIESEFESTDKKAVFPKRTLRNANLVLFQTILDLKIKSNMAKNALRFSR